MNQLNFYKYATWGLLILNLAMITFFFLTKPGHGHQGPPPLHMSGGKNTAIDILNLNEEQYETFLQSAKKHEKRMFDISNQQKQLLEPYFKTLTEASNALKQTTRLEEYTQLEKQKIEYTYQHFNEIKAILAPQQMEDFESFMNSLLNKILPNPKDNLRPPKDYR